MNTKLALVASSHGQVIPPDSEDRTAALFRAMTDPELEHAITGMFDAAEVSVTHYTRAMRAKLLPALVELRRRTPYGEWGPRLRKLGLSVVRVRMWAYRERCAALEIRELLGERRTKRLQREDDLSESEREVLLRAADRMAKAILKVKGDATKQNIAYALKVAEAYLEERGGLR